VGSSLSDELFAFALIMFGALTVVASFLLREKGTTGYLWKLMAIAGVGGVGVALFDERSFLVNGLPVPYAIPALTVFVFGNVAAIYSAKFVGSPISRLWIVLGGIGLAGLALFLLGAMDQAFLLDLGVEGMERLIFYPAAL
jgi:hypothetical protein